MNKPSLRTWACVLSPFALNAYLCHELFTVEYTQHMGSIEGAYISISRYALDSPGGLSWFPLWYGGIPYENSYPPLLHLLVAAFAWATGLSVALAYHTVTALMYCLGPVTLFWMSYRLSGARVASFAASLLYSLFSPSLILMPSVLEDLGTSLGPRRLQSLVYWGEGPHVMAMTLLPVAVVALAAALKKPSPIRVYGAAIALTSVVLTKLAGRACARVCGRYLRAQPIRRIFANVGDSRGHRRPFVCLGFTVDTAVDVACHSPERARGCGEIPGCVESDRVSIGRLGPARTRWLPS